MEANIFGHVVQELAPCITGMRIEKVFSPAPQTWTFALGRPGYLILYTDRKRPFLFLSKHKPENPAQPAAYAMWLRKRLRDRRIFAVLSDWPRRRVALELSAGEGRFLLLDLREGPCLVDELPEGFGATPWWPSVTDLGDADLWREHPHLSPPLREALRRLSSVEAQQLLGTLAAGQAQVFYCSQSAHGDTALLPWPGPGEQKTFASALEGAEFVYGQALGALLRELGGVELARSRARKRIERALVRMEEDQRRLQAMISGRKTGELLQAALYSLDKDARQKHVVLYDFDGHAVQVSLDPTRTIRENMHHFFARAIKGERGLVTVAERIANLKRELIRLESSVPAGMPRAGQPLPAAHLPAKYGKVKVSVYKSSDGFFIIRGRNSEANHKLLSQIASPFDYWLHAQDGPGAHVLIKRDFVKQEVPETTIQEAAGLAALASHLKMSDRGDVLLCLVQDVRKMKGAALGMVLVDKVLRTVRPNIDPALEDRLRVELSA